MLAWVSYSPDTMEGEVTPTNTDVTVGSYVYTMSNVTASVKGNINNRYR